MRLIYDGISPFTGNQSLAIEPDVEKSDMMKLCMDTGYHTYERHWKIGSDVIPAVESQYPNILIDTKKEVDGNVWYKILLTTPFVILTPEYNDDKLVWAIYNLKNGDPRADDIIMVIENSEGEPIYRTIDRDDKITFEEGQFSEAMDRFQMIVASVYGKISEMLNESSEEE